MARVLLLCTAEKGHLNPLVGVAQWLRRDGHHVGWLNIPDPAPELARLDVETVAIDPPLPRPPHVTQGAELARLVRDGGALRSWIQTLLLDAVPAQIEPLRAAYRRFRPDVVATDPMLYQAVIAAHLEALPWAGISSSLNPVTPDHLDSDLLRTVRELSPQRAELFASFGLAPEFRVCDCLSPWLTTVFSTAAYVGDMELPPATHLVGPTIPPGPRGDETEFPWPRLDGGRPVVYASFGSQISYQPSVFEKLSAATAPLDVTLVISAGELAIDPRLAAPHVVAVPYAPQLALLERAALFVTHGGANSVMESLHAGVPLLLSPVCNDQPHQAHFVTRAGVGEVLDLELADVTSCREAIARLLDPAAPQHGAVARVRDSYRANDGARVAARLIAELA